MRLLGFSADHDLALDHPWCTRDRVGEITFDVFDLPGEATALPIDGDESAIEGSHVDLVAVDGDSAVREAAAHVTNPVSINVEIVSPVQRTRRSIERVDYAEGCTHVHHAVDDERRRLDTPFGREVEAPGESQSIDAVLADGGELAETLLSVIAAMREPALRSVRRIDQTRIRYGCSVVDLCRGAGGEQKPAGRQGQGRGPVSVPLGLDCLQEEGETACSSLE